MEPAATVQGRLGRYEIRGVLGAGAMALVLDGWDPAIGRRAAIKTIRRDQLEMPDADEVVERFKREAQAAGRLNHPNIVSVYEYGEDQGIAYIAMEYIKGRELKDYFDKNERFPIADVVRLMTQILGALEVAHKNGVIHRDIKPGNIYVLEDGSAKVTDFGIARVESSSLTQVGMVLGTPPYMSPEQFMGHTLDGRSDLFSAGTILYQFLTGEKPFGGNQASTIMHKVLEVDPPAPSQLNVQVPRQFDGVLKKALAKRPDDRFATAREFSDALNAAAAGKGIPPKIDIVVSDVGDTARQAAAAAPVPASGGKRTAVFVMGGLLVAAIGIGVWLSKKLQAPAPSPSPPAATVAKVERAPPKESAAVPPPVVAPKPYDPVQALERVFEARDRDHPVNVISGNRVQIGKDRLSFRVTSGKPGYVYVLMVGTDRSFNLLFPNDVDSENRIAAGQALDLPRTGWSMTAGGPKGTDHFVAVVSENPRDFTAAGLRKVDPFAEFPADVAAKLSASAGNAPLFAGTPVCKGGGACSARYGAAIFTVEEVD